MAFEVGETEGNLPRSPGMVYGWEAFPIIYLAREMLGREDCRQGHHHEFDIGDGHARPFCLFCASSIITMNWGIPSART
jgi:hypothetical protein